MAQIREAALDESGRRLKYRPDIDGLRAVAVLLVVFCHLSIWKFQGGFVGVDVFFVISGYLISSTILSEMSSGKFSIVSFYERRIRRIFPAMLATMLFTSILAYRYLPPTALKSFSQSLLAALFSVSNLFFWHQAGYFDDLSSSKPLLHTWSLAVEEQFYIFFPVFLIAIHRWFQRWLQTAIWVLTGVSFLLACVWVKHDPTTAFFWAPLRAWELLIGTIVSQEYLPQVRGRILPNLLALSGLSLILAAGVFYSSSSPFPGLLALPPCLGAALIIAAGQTDATIVGRILASRPVVFVGLISYSLYLWHWPIFVFQNLNEILVDRPNEVRYAKFAVLITSLLVATISWRFIETPFRKGRLRPNRRSLFLISGVAFAMVLFIGVAMDTTQGFPSRYAPDMLKVAQFTDFNPGPYFRSGTCFLEPANHFSNFDASTCLHDDVSRRHYLLLGDSMAAHLYYGLRASFPDLNISQATASECHAFLKQPVLHPPYGDNCTQLSQYVYSSYLLNHHIDTVLLSGLWEQRDFPGLAETISWFKQRGIRVIVFGPLPSYDASLPRLLIASMQSGDQSKLERHFVPNYRSLDEQMATLASGQWDVRYISAFKDLCGPGIANVSGVSIDKATGCAIYAEPYVPVVFDEHHLTPQGSLLYARVVRDLKQLP